MITQDVADSVEPVAVGPGCYRRDLPTVGRVRAWIVDMEPGAQWPYVDRHDQHGEHLLVVSGDLIEDGHVYPAGSYLVYPPHSSHRPRTDTGVRLFGFNLY